MINHRSAMALDWLSRSEIYHTDGIYQGGVNQSYNVQRKSYPYIYCEITGYAVSTFLNAYRWSGDARHLDSAMQSAQFLLRTQEQHALPEYAGALPQGIALPELTPMRRYYSFDGAMVLQGLMDLYAVQPTGEVFSASIALGDFLIKMQRPDGSFRACLHGDENPAPGAYDPFGDGGCLHAKHAIGLLKLSQASQQDQYTASAARVCDWVLRLQDSDGAFHAKNLRDKVVSHTHCYTTEGLLYAYHILRKEAYLQAAVRSADWLARAQDRSGAIHMDYKQDWRKMGRRLPELLRPKKVVDATAQAVRIWLLLDAILKSDRYRRAAGRARNFLYRMQCLETQDKNALGGFYSWKGHPKMYAWGTMFALTALQQLQRPILPDCVETLFSELF